VVYSKMLCRYLLGEVEDRDSNLIPSEYQSDAASLCCYTFAWMGRPRFPSEITRCRIP
jgi:hypothetical protein